MSQEDEAGINSSGVTVNYSHVSAATRTSSDLYVGTGTLLEHTPLTKWTIKEVQQWLRTVEDGIFSDYAAEFELVGKFFAGLTQKECMTIAGKKSVGISIFKAIASLKTAQGTKLLFPIYKTCLIFYA